MPLEHPQTPQDIISTTHRTISNSLTPRKPNPVSFSAAQARKLAPKVVSGDYASVSSVTSYARSVVSYRRYPWFVFSDYCCREWWVLVLACWIDADVCMWFNSEHQLTKVCVLFCLFLLQGGHSSNTNVSLHRRTRGMRATMMVAVGIVCFSSTVGPMLPLK
jgi:hypothetical protein